ncbi:hypothetical protein OOT55_11780 [Marinimicrobium sp. C6131]|uniref:hypothetical protein n=1 Tax=Marinimicrobium sp. C6131 TaxID=3022676 RepID=UPI00223D3F26|nr:hypothetical protein [Marinimicrobium sp. C6131]UZJ43331.1 hypothetical protein OOT55_11780 [Marinimicrobium sp. C6131]
MKTHTPIASTALALVTLLGGCGGEREEAFNPSEPDEIRDPVAVSFVYENSSADRNNTGFPATDVDSRRIEIIRDPDDYEFLIDAYRDIDDFVEAPDFEEGQVILYDSGWFDDSACAQQLNLNRVQAFSITEDENVVEVVLNYRLSEADEDASCDEEIPFRTWELHYVESRADLIVVEEVSGLGSSSASSSSSSSSSSNGS